MRSRDRSGPRRPITPIGHTLEGLLGAGPAGQRMRENLALAHWAEAVGGPAAAASEPEHIMNGVLVVRTRSSVWSQELTLLKATIIERLNARVGGQVVRDIRFKASGRSRTAEPELDAGPDDAAIDAVALLPEDREQLDALARDLEGMQHDARRASMLRVVERRMKMRRWRLMHGERACPVCGAAYGEPGDVCPVCRLTR